MNKDKLKNELEEIIKDGLPLRFAVTKILCGGSRPCSEHAKQAEEIAQAMLEYLPPMLTPLILKLQSETRERTLEEVRQIIEESMIRKNAKNEAMYEVEIDNYNMALLDLDKLLEELKKG